MADTARLMEALRNADAAGDVEAATRIAQMIRAAQAVKQPTYGWEKNADPTGSFLENAAAGLGKEVADIGLGAQQMVADAGIYGDPEALRQEELDRNQRDAALQGTAGGLTGQAVGVLGSMALPGGTGAKVLTKVLPRIGGALGGAAGGAAAGAFEPVTEDNERLTNMAVTGAFGGAGGAIPAVLRGTKGLGGAILDRVPVLGEMRQMSRRTASAAEREAAAMEREAAAALRAEQAAALRAERSAAKEATAAEGASTRSYLEAELRGGVDELSGGLDPTDIAQALRSQGIKKMGAAEKAVGARYDEIEKAADALGPVDVQIKLGDKMYEELAAAKSPLIRRLATEDAVPRSPSEVRNALRDLNEMPSSPAVEQVKQQLKGALDEWGGGSDEAAAALKKMQAVDRLFRTKIGKPRADFGIKGTTRRLHQTNYPREEAIIAALRSPTKAGPTAARLLKNMPESEEALRKMVGALGTEDTKFLTGAAAKRVLTQDEQARLEALLKALKGG